ncbi:hypothetical protein CEXT_149501 [Caerostris extrusa]|uniref:Uncharacterized protein n=1 Tax=Caerostris extrusa TaxID=172846 RepID=A0AAV4XTG8_CAEEX|nr:hypothetical protein CEXT_149501 [Caerostris extrusa]
MYGRRPTPRQKPSGQETVANDEPAQDYDEFDIDLSTPLVIVEDDLLVHTEQTTPSTLAQNHKETIPSTETQTREKILYRPLQLKNMRKNDD